MKLHGYPRGSATRYDLRDPLTPPSLKLSKSFRLTEFQSKDGSPIVLVHPMLVLGLQEMRDALGVPITVNSGYRTVSHNRKVKGTARSLHLSGMASDIMSRQCALQKIHDYAKTMGWGACVLYSAKGFIHVDVGAIRSW